MSLSAKAFSVVTRPLPREAIKKRPGKAGMEFSYIAPDFVIDTLNEAFEHQWNTKIVYQGVHDGVVIVGLRLSVPNENGVLVEKEQFGSCEITRGLAVGEAFKGAASDALKKCATLLGIGLELYRDEEPVGGPSAPSFAPPRPSASSRPASLAGTRPPAPPAPRPPAPSAPPPPRAPAAPPTPRKDNPFAGNGSSPALPKPTPPVTRAPAPPAAPKANPFAAAAGAGTGPNPTQLNALTNLAQRRGLDAAGLIGLAGVVDDGGNPIHTFEDLTREQAIQVIRAAQQ